MRRNLHVLRRVADVAELEGVAIGPAADRVPLAGQGKGNRSAIEPRHARIDMRSPRSVCVNAGFGKRDAPQGINCSMPPSGDF
jgi:hypothetical protein